MKKNNNKSDGTIVLFVILILLILSLIYVTFVKLTYVDKSSVEDISNNENNEFNIKLIKSIYNKAGYDNFLVNPYSVELMINALRDGSDGNTLSEFNKVIDNHNIVKFDINNRFGIGNALFVNSDVNIINETYKNNIKDKYNMDVILNSDVNTWSNEVTNGVITNVVDSLSDDSMFGIINTTVIDIDWGTRFKCYNTIAHEFSRTSNDIYEVEMMHDTYSDAVKYFKTSSSEGIIIPFQKYNSAGDVDEEGKTLEFVGIKPNENINNYINYLDETELNSIDSNVVIASDSSKISVYIPRFKYSFSLNEYKDVLTDIGINKAFDKNKANFANMINDKVLYLDKTIHRSFIDFNENGTKFSYVVYVDEEKKEVDQGSLEIKFDKPFLYMIRDKDSRKILLFGIVYNPNIWKGSTCDERE